MEFTVLIIEEILKFLSLSEQVKLRRLSRGWCQVITPLAFNTLEYFCPYSGVCKSYSIPYLSKFGHLVTHVLLDNFTSEAGEHILSMCPSLHTLTLKNFFMGDFDHLPSNFYDFYNKLPKLKKLHLAREFTSAVPIKLLQQQNKLVSLSLQGDSINQFDLVEVFRQLPSTRMRYIKVEFGHISRNLAIVLGEKFPHLEEFDIRIAHYSPDDISSLNQLIPAAAVTWARIDVPDSVNYTNIRFDLSLHPKLNTLILHSFILDFQDISSPNEWPQLQNLKLYGIFGDLPCYLTNMFPNLQALDLNSMEITPLQYQSLLTKLTKVKNLFLTMGCDSDIVFDLPAASYSIIRLSIVFVSRATPRFFGWISASLPRLKELQVSSYNCQDIEEAFFKSSPNVLPITRFVSLDVYSLEFWIKLDVICPELLEINLKKVNNIKSSNPQQIIPRVLFNEYIQLSESFFRR